jgi:hypothetical protein
MRILLDHCVPKRLASLLSGHDVKTTRRMRWEELKNGELLQKAGTQFEVMVTTDKKLRFELNLKTLSITIVILDSKSNAFPELAPFAPHLQLLLSNPLPKSLHILHIDGTVERL